MQVIDVLTSPWAIQQEKLVEIVNIYSAHVRGEKADLAAIEARLGKPLDNTRKAYTVDNGVAILPMEGVVSKRMNLFTSISGGTSTQLMARDLQQALQDPEVQSIVLSVDSPGGTVDGTQALASQIRAARGQKPIVAVADGLMASAAYWIGSAADRVYASSATTIVGSIGVVSTHVDQSEADKQAGVKVTEITAGKYKRIASEHAPLSPEGRQSIQDQVDQIYSVFVNDVAANRGTDADSVLGRMADGRTFMGQKAVDAGLVDGIATLDQIVAALQDPSSDLWQELQDDEDDQQENDVLTGARAPESTAEVKHGMYTQEQLDAAKAEAAAAERARIQAVEAQGEGMPGHEALVAAMKYDGQTSGEQAAGKLLAAHKASMKQTAEALAADAPKAAPTSNPTTDAINAQADAAAAAAAGTDQDPMATARELSTKATAYIAQQAAAGVRVDMATAVQHVLRTQK